MNWNMIEVNWQQFKGVAKDQWGKLTEDQLAVIAGRRDMLADEIQEMYGLTMGEAEKQIRVFEERNMDYQYRQLKAATSR